MTEPETPAVFSPWQALLLAVIFVSSSAILIRFTEAAPLSVAGWRLGLAAGVLALFPSVRRGLAGVPARDLALTAGAGLFLAAHFGAWIASLRLLPVAISVILVSTHPMFIVLFRLLIGRPPGFWEITGVGVAFAGLGVMTDVAHATEGAPATSLFPMGVALALSGAIALAGYLLVAAEVRPRVHATSFLALAYGTAAVALFAFLLGAGGSAVPPSTREFALYAFLALAPTLGGHGLFAYAVRYLSPVLVSAAFLAEPVVATLLAVPVFREIPAPRVIWGGLTVLAGLGLAMLGSRRAPDGGD